MRFLLVLLCLLSPVMLFGQFENGSLVGTVRDGSGAVVAAATVTVTNTQTGIEVAVDTGSDGNYEVPSLRVGTYKVSAAKAGFDNAVTDGVPLSVGSRQRVDLTLSVSGGQQAVEVSAEALSLETDSSQRGQIETQYQIKAFPLSTRTYSALVALTTGVRVSSIGISTIGTGLVREGSFNVEGQRSMYNNFLLDGLDNNAYNESNQGFSNQVSQPSPDSIAQFQVVTNNESAEYGRGPGATINVAFASGTNKLHFGLYEFLRNTDFNAVGYIAPPGGIKPDFKRNQFGGTVSGPILKNKAFFFADYEGFRQVRSLAAFLTLPIDSERPNPATNTVTFPVAVQNPFNAAQLYPAGTPIPTSVLSPAAVRIAALLPPTTAGATTAGNDYETLQHFTDRTDKEDIRLDYQINQKTSSFARLSQRKENAVDGAVAPQPIDGGTNGRQRILDQQIAGGITRQIGTNQLLDFRFGWNYIKGGKFSLSLGQPDDFGIANLPTDPLFVGGLPTLVINNYSNLGRQATNPQWQYPIMYNPKVNYSWVKGKHSLKFGYEYVHVSQVVQDVNPLDGRFTFQGGFTTPTGAKTANDNYWADFLFGAPSKEEISTFHIAHMRLVQHSAYVQDDWRISPQFTLNIGLRYEYGSPYWEKDNILTNFDPATSPLTGKLVSAKGGSTYDRALVNPDRKNFAPRFGFAYAATPLTSIRGGFGISYIHLDRPGAGNLLAINAPQVLFVVQSQTPAGSGAAYRKLDAGFQPGVTLPASFNPLNDNITYIPKDYKAGYVESYFLSVQRQLFKNSVFDVAYVGNHSLKLQEFGNFNQKNPSKGFARPFPTFGDITETFNGASGNYNALQVRYEQRFVAGLSLLNSFTWSRAFDISPESLEDANGNFPGPQDINNIAAEYGPSQYDQPLNNTTSLVYDLPFGKGRRFANTGGLLNEAVGGWQVSAINNMFSGQPLTIAYGPAAANQVSGITADFRGANNYRPNRVPGVSLLNHGKVPNAANSVQFLNAAAFTTVGLAGKDANGVPLSPFGNEERNPIRSDPYFSTDIAVAKDFALPLEGMNLQFRAEAYNVLNKTNFQPPATTFGSGSFGRITANFDPRILQLALKLSY